MRIINWAKQNKLAALLLVILAFFLLKNSFINFLGFGTYNLSIPSYERSTDFAPDIGSISSLKMAAPNIGGGIMPPYSAPPSESKNRMVVQNSYLSLLVKNVAKTLKDINLYIENHDGYMINTNLSNPQDAATADISIRLPAKKLSEALEYFRSLSVKVTSERLDGYDVTDEYADIDAKLATLNSNLARFKEIMNKAEKVEEILNVQQQIFNLQDQIDNYKGRKQYLEQTSKLAKITLYLSTDEYSLPYAPSASWRPEVIFKTAVRSLIKNIQNLGTLAIWSGVYAVIWIPVVFLIILIRRRKKS